MRLRPKDNRDRFTTQPRAGSHARPEAEVSPAAGSLREALEICLKPEHLRRTLPIALVVGTILTLINQADVIVAGEADTRTWVKAALNFCVPFVVSNLGLLAGKRAERKPSGG